VWNRYSFKSVRRFNTRWKELISVLAATAGAKHVYAIEASGLATKARENITKNGFKDTITYVLLFGQS
jgi:predicted nicotinamide N-methyase